MSSRPGLVFNVHAPEAGSTFTVDDAQACQKIDGFGASFMEAGMICLNSLPGEKRDEVLAVLANRRRKRPAFVLIHHRQVSGR